MQQSGTSIYLFAVSFSDNNAGIVVGGDFDEEYGPLNCVILHTTDGGVHWKNQTAGHLPLYGVSFVNGNTGTAVGHQGIIYGTTNGGTTWVAQASATNQMLDDVCVADELTAFAVGFSGTIVKTTDGGSTWKNLSGGTSTWLRGLCFTGADNGTVVGLDGIILRTTTGGVSDVGDSLKWSSDVPRYFILDQNYPNPFNPSTTIRYGLPHKTTVQLSVYNILGQSVSTLVNGEQEAGYHEVQFDGSKLASGVYLYRMQAGTYVEMRKLLLVR